MPFPKLEGAVTLQAPHLIDFSGVGDESICGIAVMISSCVDYFAK